MWSQIIFFSTSELFSENEITETILHYPFLPSRLKAFLAPAEKQEDHYLMNISEDQANEIRDLCGEQLQVVGFDEKYELTPEGKILESLVDKFFIE